MTAEQYLYRYQNARIEIRRLKGVLAEVESIADAKSLDTSREPVQTSGASDIVGSVAAKAADLQCVLNDRLLEAFDLLVETEAVIEQVKDARERALLTKRFIEGLSWVRVADEMYISRRHIWRVRDRALESVEKY